MNEEALEDRSVLFKSPTGSAPRAFSRLDQSILGSWWWTVDRVTVLSVFILMAFGLAMVYSASPSVARTIQAPELHFFYKHIAFLAVSIICFIFCSMLTRRFVWRAASLMLFGTFLMMIAVLIFGAEIKGAKRWISILGFTLQPSEFLKPAFIIVTAWLISLYDQKKQDEKIVSNFNTPFLNGYVVSIGFLYCTGIALLLSQPDFGISVIVTSVLIAQIFLAGMRFRYIAIIAGLGACAVGFVYYAFDHVRSRVDRFLDPQSGDNYQVENALSAIKNGGFFGVGPGQGVEKTSIPDAHSDFIFAVIVEEAGLLFAALLIGVYAMIILRGFKRLKQTDDLFAVLAAGGLLIMIAMQSIIHIGSTINIIPTKGMTLPFISYGGSSMLSISITMGMILALTRQRTKKSISRATLTLSKKQSAGT